MKTAEWKEPLQLHDETGKLAKKIAENWLIGLRETNPAILDMFHERDRKPYRDLLPWSGEFAGKYITGAYYIYKLGHHDALYSYILQFLDELLTCIDEEGYVGCYQKACRLTGAYSQDPATTGVTWDAWSHYHIMFGLYLWYHETQETRYFEALQTIAAFFLRTFYTNGKRLADIGSCEMNLSILHIIVLLYQDTKDKRYLSFAKEIEKDLTLPTAGDYIRHALAGTEFYQCPKPRWESLHVIMGIAALFRATNDEKYQKAALQIFYSILKSDIHNTGGFSTDEQAVGTPFINGNIELCCVIAYNALACDILKMTGDIQIVDFLELSLYNAVMGSFSPTGRWSTYNTPMEGEKQANYHSIHFQCRPGSPELNCCSTNAARGIGTLAEWAVMEEEGTVYLHYYGSLSGITSSGLEIRIEGNYPVSNQVRLLLHSISPQRVALRIPSWSKRTVISYNGHTELPLAGTYWITEHVWHHDEIQIQFDFTPRLLAGGGDYSGKSSIYMGPLLYGYDSSIKGSPDLEHLPPISLSALLRAEPFSDSDGRILLKLSDHLFLCDFRHLGLTGSAYTTWFTCQE